MTIFKHFYESRGNSSAAQGSEFYSYRALYKIAFPPTHPQCRDLFEQVMEIARLCYISMTIKIMILLRFLIDTAVRFRLSLFFLFYIPLCYRIPHDNTIAYLIKGLGSSYKI